MAWPTLGPKTAKEQNTPLYGANLDHRAKFLQNRLTVAEIWRFNGFFNTLRQLKNLNFTNSRWRTAGNLKNR